MSPVPPASGHAFEDAVLDRAKRNFRNDGLGNRMWDDPSVAPRSKMDNCFTLDEEQRRGFIADARAEIENEGRSIDDPDTEIDKDLLGDDRSHRS